MSYSEEQQRAYADVQYRLGEFEKLKVELRAVKCEIHNKKCKVDASWEGSYEVHIFIEKYCCRDFAGRVAESVESQNMFDAVIIRELEDGAGQPNPVPGLLKVNDYIDLVNQYSFEEFPLAIYGGERRLASFITIEHATLDLKIHLCKVVLKRCFSATLGDLVFPWDYEWFIKHFFSEYKQDQLKPGLSGAIQEAYEMMQASEPFTKGIVATTFLFGVIEFYVKYELGFRPYDFDFFDNSKKGYYRQHFADKKRIPPELSLGKGIELLLKQETEIANALKELEQHNIQRLNQRNIHLEQRWIYPQLSRRLSLFRNTVLHGEQHSFFSVGHYLLMLYSLFHLCHEKKMIQST
jgi:hypothetical protein